MELMNKILFMKVKKMCGRDIFRFGVDAITQKNPEDNINYSIQELQKARDRIKEVQDYYHYDFTKKKGELEDLISKAVYDYHQIKEYREEIAELETKLNQRIADLEKLIVWLDMAIL